ncbi:MAG: hypothetical protein RL141_298 [Candidatus Parcubacteria bacterium]
MWIVWLVLGIVGTVVIIFIIQQLRRLLGRPELHGMSREAILKHWEEIERISGSGHMGAKMAIVEADKLLDAALKSMMMSGSTLGERLKFAAYKYPAIRKVWNAHRMRNQIVHETTFQVSASQARGAIRDYKQALQVLKVL